jgi:GTPase Era involved in 16S rRNA processing
MIQMRRTSKDDSDSSPVTVTLLGPHGTTVSTEKFSTDEAIRDAVEKLQTKAVELSGSKQFVDDHIIKVHIQGPKLINLTLVDLPGFHTANDQDTQTVNDMVKRYIEMPGTLVLHVVKGDQDYASLLGNDFMRQTVRHENARVTVLTHCDNLKSQSDHDRTRLRTTLDATSENSSLTVALLGCAQDDDEEASALRHLTAIDSRVAIGNAVAKTHLEHQMFQHLIIQFPKAARKLEQSYRETQVAIELVRERAPFEVLHEKVSSIERNYEERKLALLNDVRTIRERLVRMISNYTLKPIGTKPTTTDFPVLSVTKVTPEVGTEVQVGVNRFDIIEKPDSMGLFTLKSVRTGVI